MRSRAAVAVELLSLLCAAAARAEPGQFSARGLEGWAEQTFRGRKPTEYRLARDAGVQVLEADCKASASGWMWKEKIDLRRTPVLRWRWKAASMYAGLREREKRGDDFPARVYVVLGGRTLVYVWASEAAPLSDWVSPYTSRAHIVALRSGPGQWLEEKRDVQEDLRRYLGIEATHIDGVAVMTDCDDAGGATRAWYGDLRFEK